MPAIIQDTYHHPWTDALHGRTLAKDAKSKWNRGSYVRWTVLSACHVLELACQDALDDQAIGYKFRNDIDKALAKFLSAKRINWGEGTWQRVAELRKLRKDFVHCLTSQDHLFPSEETAVDVISTVRQAVIDIYCRVDKPAPSWIDDDSVIPWDRPRSFANAYTTAKEAKISPDSNERRSDAIGIYYVFEDKEFPTAYLGPDADFSQHIQQLPARMKIPITEIRVRKGQELIYSEKIAMRG